MVVDGLWMLMVANSKGSSSRTTGKRIAQSETEVVWYMDDVVIPDHAQAIFNLECKPQIWICMGQLHIGDECLSIDSGGSHRTS